MTARVLLALLAGLALGAGAAASDSETLRGVALAIEPVGTLWTNAIRMTVVPLVVALVITGVASHADLGRIGRLGVLAVPVFVTLLGAFVRWHRLSDMRMLWDTVSKPTFS